MDSLSEEGLVDQLSNPEVSLASFEMALAQLLGLLGRQQPVLELEARARQVRTQKEVAAEELFLFFSQQASSEQAFEGLAELERVGMRKLVCRIRAELSQQNAAEGTPRAAAGVSGGEPADVNLTALYQQAGASKESYSMVAAEDPELVVEEADDVPSPTNNLFMAVSEDAVTTKAKCCTVS